VKATTDEWLETITDQQVQSFARSLVHRIYRDRNTLDRARALSFLQALLRRIVSEQITAIECLGGLSGWSRDSLNKLLSDAAEIELTQITSTFAQAFEFEMKTHVELTAEPKKERSVDYDRTTFLAERAKYIRALRRAGYEWSEMPEHLNLANGDQAHQIHAQLDAEGWPPPFGPPTTN